MLVFVLASICAIGAAGCSGRGQKEDNPLVVLGCASYTAKVKRITSRPWSADAYLKETVYRLVLGKKSVGTTIEHSQSIKQIFGDYVKLTKERNTKHPLARSVRSVRNLRASRVRFDSCTKPLGRFVMWCPAILATLINLVTTRKGRQESKFAEEALQFVDPERILTLGMLADAGDEALMVARFFDSEQHDLARCHEIFEAFRARVDFLFVQSQCLQSGFTKCALDGFKKQYTFILRGRPQTLGGPVDQGMVERCLQRMRLWVYLATTTIQSEFPGWDITQMFSILDLSLHGGPSTPGKFYEMSMERVASLLHLPLTQLCEQIAMVLPIAFQLKESSTLSNIEAWAKAVRRLTARDSMKLFGKLESLRTLLVRALAWNGCTTSGVEQTFSLMDLLVTNIRPNQANPIVTTASITAIARPLLDTTVPEQVEPRYGQQSECQMPL